MKITEQFNEAEYIAVVQISGLADNGLPDDADDGIRSTYSGGFSNHRSAVEWARQIVEDAHCEIALIVPSMATFAFDFGGEPQRKTHEVTMIVSPGGPTVGFVIRTFDKYL